MRATPALAYALTSVCLGAIAVFASENLFWSAPKTAVRPGELALTILAYSLCAAGALSGVLWSRLGGWRALFLGGAILGWLVEGVLVATAYDAFPLQLVWTPLAWHALITALGVVGLARYAVHGSVLTQLAASIALGSALGAFGLYWPLERGRMPSTLTVLGYLVGIGALVPVCSIVLDRVGRVSRPSGRTMAIAPCLLGAIWCVRFVLAPSPVRVSVPLLVALTLWIMRRLAPRDRDSASDALELGPRAPRWRHALFLSLPLATTLVCSVGWSRTNGLHTNIPFALCTSLLSFGLYVRLGFVALRPTESTTNAP